LGVGAGVLLVVGHVAHAAEAAIGALDDIGGALAHLGGGGDLQLDFAQRLVDVARADVELHVELRLIGPLEALGSLGVLDRQVLDVLRQDAGDRQGIGAVAALGGIGIEIGEHVAFVGHNRSFAWMGFAGPRASTAMALPQRSPEKAPRPGSKQAAQVLFICIWHL